MIDFSKVEAPKDLKYLNPGVYMLHATEVKLEEPAGKTPCLNITFEGQEGMVRQKFYLSEKALPNLLYLHEGIFGKGITKAFENNAQVHAYFEKALTSKQVDKPFLVGGQEADNGKVYCELPFGSFIFKEGVSYTLGEFEPNSSKYAEVIRKSTTRKDLPETSSLLPDLGTSILGEEDSSMPW